MTFANTLKQLNKKYDDSQLEKLQPRFDEIVNSFKDLMLNAAEDGKRELTITEYALPWHTNEKRCVSHLVRCVSHLVSDLPPKIVERLLVHFALEDIKCTQNCTEDNNILISLHFSWK